LWVDGVARHVLAHRGYDADWIRALAALFVSAYLEAQ
jgi:hypothetical protein